MKGKVDGSNLLSYCGCTLPVNLIPTQATTAKMFKALVFQYNGWETSVHQSGYISHPQAQLQDAKRRWEELQNFLHNVNAEREKLQASNQGDLKSVALKM